MDKEGNEMANKKLQEKIRWRDETVALAGVGWRTLTSDRKGEGVGKGLCLAVG